MKIEKVFILWDENEGFNFNASKVYKNTESAEISLKEHYPEYFIQSGKAKILEIELIDYFNLINDKV